MSWEEFRRDVAPCSARGARDALADRFAPITKERLELGRAVGSHARAEHLHKVVPFKEAYSHSIVREVIEHVDMYDGAVLDPFVGSGTTLMVAAEEGLVGVGVDILPYAVFATSTLLRAPVANWAKVHRLADAVLSSASYEVGEFPDFPASSWAFSKAALAELTTLHDAIRALRAGVERDILRLALLTVVEDVSQATKDGTSLRRRPHGEGRRGRYGARRTRQQVRARFNDQLESMQAGAQEQPAPPAASHAVIGDARELQAMFSHGQFRLAMFSPPYPNRYDYAANYQLELGFGFVKDNERLKQLRRTQLRSHLECPWADRTLDVPALDEFLRGLMAASDAPGERGRVFRMVSGYFEDMRQVLRGLRQVLAPGATVAMVVGTQTFCGETLPTDLILAEIAEAEGFEAAEIWIARHKGIAVQQRLRGAVATSRESVVLLDRQ